jgi:hypothetical protein
MVFNPPLKPTDLRCRKCRQEKHRKHFVPRDSTKTRYDYMCTTCRNSPKTYISPPILEQRVREGLMTAKQRDKILAARAAYKRTLPQNMWRGKELACAATWEQTIKSAYKAKWLLTKAPDDTPERKEWKERMGAFIQDTLTQIHAAKRKSKLPSDAIVMWYDALDGTRSNLMRLRREYPDGEDQCPIGVI